MGWGMSEILNQAAAWATVGAFVVAVVSLGVIAFQAQRYMAVRDADLRQREFENYHKLIRDLSRGGEEVRQTSQAAIIFELRNYPKYAEISRRILLALKNRWGSENIDVHHTEIDLTLAALERIKDPK